jgi:hypothetical protein
VSSVYSGPISKLVTRLAAHCRTGHLLDGYKWHDVPVQEQNGPSDLPAVQLFIPEISEGFRAQSVGSTTMDIKISVSVRLSSGIASLLAATEAVMNAIETDEVTGSIDPCLGKTLGAPFDMATKDSGVTGLSITMLIVVTCLAKPFRRGAR